MSGGLQLLVHLLIHGVTKLCCVIYRSVRLELISPVPNRKVVLRQLRLCGLRIHLPASQPALVTQHQSAADGRPGEAKMHLAAQADELLLLPCLNCSISAPSVR